MDDNIVTKATPEVREAAAIIGNQALIVALLKHVSANQIDVLRSIAVDAIERIPQDKPGQEIASASQVARAMIAQVLGEVGDEIQSRKTTGTGAFQEVVNRGY